MSELVLTLVAGSAGRNSGKPRSAAVLGALHVGGSGLWVFSDQDPGAPGPARRIQIRAGRDLAVEVLAGVALAANFDDAASVADRVLAANWREAHIEAEPEDLQPLAAIASKFDVAVVVTDFGGGGEQITAMGHALYDAGWSVIVAEPTLERRRSQWDRPTG